MKKCNVCGLCCKAIVYPKAKIDLDDNEPSERFVKIYWKRLSKTDALRINPRLKMINYKVYFYRCRKFDRYTNLCRIHDQRPDICRNYPTYMKLSRQMSYSENCGYFKK